MVMSYPKLTKEVLQLLEKFVVCIFLKMILLSPCFKMQKNFFNRENVNSQRMVRKYR